AGGRARGGQQRLMAAVHSVEVADRHRGGTGHRIVGCSRGRLPDRHGATLPQARGLSSTAHENRRARRENGPMRPRTWITAGLLGAVVLVLGGVLVGRLLPAEDAGGPVQPVIL